jgi:polyisoprenoid-binding protein YceI
MAISIDAPLASFLKESWEIPESPVARRTGPRSARMGAMARRLVNVATVLVLLVGGAFAVFALRGSDAPPPPTLSSDAPAATATPTAAEDSAAWEIAPGPETFVGYRVREEFASIGVADAVGRTGGVTGTADVEGDRLTAAGLEADMTTLRSDESRRDDALRERGIETDRFPTAEFRLTEPVDLARRNQTVRGELTLHGETQPIAVRVSAQRLGGDTIELAGSAPIAFADFRIEPPSVAGVVTVEDEGTLEFKLRLRPSG